MSRFVALLRGVNVGRVNRVPMAELRALLEGLGYRDVKTLLNSGNAVFTASSRSTEALARTIHDALKSRLRIDVGVIVKSANDIEAVTEGNALAGHGVEPARLLVAFARQQSALQDLAVTARLVQPGERFVVGADAAYLLCANGILESKAASALLGKVGKDVTTRNWATVLKLAALLREP